MDLHVLGQGGSPATDPREARSGLDVAGLTFVEAMAALTPCPRDIRGLRQAYQRVISGEAEEAGPWRVDLHPIVRHVHDGDLTKFVQRRPDGLEIESVMIPMRGKDGRQWKTLCVSSQVGCARGCAFCETAQLGLLAQLSAAEIVGQVIAANGLFGGRVRNVVFMGMGEPFDNFRNVLQALRVMTDRNGLSFGMDRLTLSTVGRTDGIRQLAALRWRRFNLAVSLNAPNDEIRSRLMPINELEPMDRLREALVEYPLRKCQFIMIEYVLIPGVNDAYEHARELAQYLRPVKCMVNVIPYNPRRDSPWPAPRDEAVSRFMDWLTEFGQPSKRRETKGRSYMAACGQLGNRELLEGRRRARAAGAGCEPQAP